MKTEIEKKAFLNRWVTNVLSFSSAIVVVLAFRSSVIESVKIPSGSMLPTILIGDYIFVAKFAYGLRIPFTRKFIWEGNGPTRGDVVVFDHPENESIYYIKRVVGIPGDTIEVKRKVLYVNGKPMSRTLLPNAARKSLIKDVDLSEMKWDLDGVEVFSEDLNGVHHWTMFNNNRLATLNYGPVEIPQDRYFVMGDNRDNSNDSRFWGFVSRRHLQGKALMIWMSLWLDSDEIIFRSDRIGKRM